MTGYTYPPVSGIVILAVLFVRHFVIETSGKSLERIEQKLHVKQNRPLKAKK